MAPDDQSVRRLVDKPGHRPGERRELKVATYNVHSCVGLDGKLDAARVAAVIRALDADIVALQEVDASHRSGVFLDQWGFLGDAAGYHSIPGVSLRTHRKKFGNALLTRLPVLGLRFHDISVPGREPRGVIDADIAVGEEAVRVVATHMGLNRQERCSQSERLAAYLARDDSAHAAQRWGTLVMGDLNEWHPRSVGIRPLLRAFPQAPRPASFPSLFPLLSLDRILVDSRLRLIECRSFASARARRASDHLPVVARIAPSGGPKP